MQIHQLLNVEMAKLLLDIPRLLKSGADGAQGNVDFSQLILIETRLDRIRLAFDTALDRLEFKK